MRLLQILNSMEFFLLLNSIKQSMIGVFAQITGGVFIRGAVWIFIKKLTLNMN